MGRYCKGQKVQDVNGKMSKEGATSGDLSILDRIERSASVITFTLPIHLLMNMRTSIYRSRGEQIAEEKCKMMESWQERCQNATVGAWIRRLIPKVQD